MFELDPRLRQDTIPLGGLVLSRLLLMNDATFPWLILVPAEPDIREIHELAQAQQMQLMAEITAISGLMAEIFKPDKINVAALGNVVPQLHVHVIARFRSDAAWPDPVWGRVPAKPYEKGDAERLLDAIRSRLAVRIVRDGPV
ncbi:MAG: HIT family protein [Defluviicoccus sp.]